MSEGTEKNPLLQELRQGLGQQITTTPQQATPAQPSTPDKAKEEMARIIKELKQKMNEIDAITAELERKRKEIGMNSPKRTEKLLEEMRVPPLEMLT